MVVSDGSLGLLDGREDQGVQFVSAQEVGCAALVRVFGEGDVATADLLRCGLSELLSSARGRCTVDLSGLSFCDLKGMDALRAAGLTAHLAGVTVSWRGLSPLLSWVCRLFPSPSGVGP